MSRPNFLVVGAGRSGTTAVVEGLRAHPDVFVTVPKEPHYFAFHGQRVDFRGPGDQQWVNRAVVTDRSRYLELFDADHGAPARGDGSVSTLYYADRAVPEILRINPRMRTVVLLREPVERAFSTFVYLRARGVEPEQDFRRALAQEPRRRAANWQHMWHYTSMSRYATSLRTLREGLGPEQVGVWFYDSLVADYPRVLGEILTFLHLPPHPEGVPVMPRVNASGTPRVQAAQRAIRWATRHETVRSTVKRFVGFRTRERVRSAVLRRESLPRGVREELAPCFADDLRDLAELVPGEGPGWLG